MSSMGASCARVYVMKKKAEEKLKRMEQQQAERAGKREDSVKSSKTAYHGGAIAGKPSNKVHPGTIFGVPASSNS